MTSAAPHRVQRSRAKGWKMPPGAIYVGRPTRWGNPFKVGGWVRVNDGLPIKIKTPEFAVLLFREICMFRGLASPEDLRGHDLACWCPLDQPCHADVLLELANKEHEP